MAFLYVGVMMRRRTSSPLSRLQYMRRLCLFVNLTFKAFAKLDEAKQKIELANDEASTKDQIHEDVQLNNEESTMQNFEGDLVQVVDNIGYLKIDGNKQETTNCSEFSDPGNKVFSSPSSPIIEDLVKELVESDELRSNFIDDSHLDDVKDEQRASQQINNAE